MESWLCVINQGENNNVEIIKILFFKPIKPYHELM